MPKQPFRLKDLSETTWTTVVFESFQKQADFVNRYSEKLQITILYVNNGYAVECRKLKPIRQPR